MRVTAVETPICESCGAKLVHHTDFHDCPCRSWQCINALCEKFMQSQFPQIRVIRGRPNTASSPTALAASDNEDQALPAQRLKPGR